MKDYTNREFLTLKTSFKMKSFELKSVGVLKNIFYVFLLFFIAIFTYNFDIVM